MAQELIYTSVPRGLEGRTGFCTVAMTRSLTPQIVRILEGLVAYTPVFMHYVPDSVHNPPSFFHYPISDGKRQYDLLARVSSCGLDYTKRSNKIGHFFLVSEEEKACCPDGPSALLNGSLPFMAEWNGDPQYFPTERKLDVREIKAAKATAWEQATGDAGWAAWLAEKYMQEPGKPCFVLFDPLRHTNILSLVSEALMLLPRNQRWEVSWNTYMSSLPVDQSCNWRFCVDNQETLRAIGYHERANILDLRQKLGAAEGGHLQECARRGENPYPDGATSTISVLTRPSAAFPQKMDGGLSLGELAQMSNFGETRSNQTESWEAQSLSPKGESNPPTLAQLSRMKRNRIKDGQDVNTAENGKEGQDMDTIGNGTNINVAASGQSGLTMQSASNSTRTRGLYVMNGFVIALLLVLIVIQLLGLKASVEERKKDKDVQNETATTLVTSTEFKSSFSTIEQEIQALDGKLKMTMEGLDDLKKGFEAMQKYSVEMKEVVQGIKAAHEGNIQEAENQNTTLSQIADDITRIKKLYLKQNDKLNNLSDNVERMSTKINDLKNDVSPSNPLKPMSEPVNSSIEKSGNDNMGFGGEIDDEKKSNEKKGDEKKIDKEKFKDLERAFKSLSDSIDNASRYQELKSYRVKVQEAISEFKASGKSTSLDAAISELSRIIENKRAYEALIKKCDALKQEIITVKTNVSSQAVEAK